MPLKRTNNVTDEQILIAYQEQRSISKVSDVLGIGSSTVLRVLQKHDVPRTGLTEYRQTMGDPKDGPYIGTYGGSTEEILEWYASGLSMKSIAKRIGRSVHVVKRRVTQAGIARPWGARGALASNWQGGLNNTEQGYVRRWLSEDDPMASMRNQAGYVLEHRLVMARKLGRPLLKTETVHHIDGDKANCAPSNLELRQGQHGKHVVMCCLDCGSRNIGHVGLTDAPGVPGAAPRARH